MQETWPRWFFNNQVWLLSCCLKKAYNPVKQKVSRAILLIYKTRKIVIISRWKMFPRPVSQMLRLILLQHGKRQPQARYIQPIEWISMRSRSLTTRSSQLDEWRILLPPSASIAYFGDPYRGGYLHCQPPTLSKAKLLLENNRTGHFCVRIHLVHRS